LKDHRKWLILLENAKLFEKQKNHHIYILANLIRKMIQNFHIIRKEIILTWQD